MGVIVDGCPPRIPLSLEEIQEALDRRKPGQSRLTTQRKESDTVEILSGWQDGKTLGTPIAMIVRNQDARAKDYKEVQQAYRPSHADFTYQMKYGIRAKSGGGRASARETVARVAAGAVARAVLKTQGVSAFAWVSRVGSVDSQVDMDSVSRDLIEKTAVRCPDTKAAQEMIALIEKIRKAGDSVGGVVSAAAFGVPAGWGEPVFDKLDADLAKAMISLPAAKGFEIGSGFSGSYKRGSEHNDPFFWNEEEGRIGTKSNNSGGIQGGISNGEPVTCRVAFKPTATIVAEQDTVTNEGTPTKLKGRGRHDPCVLPRAVPIVEAMFDLVLADHFLAQAVVKSTD